MLDRGRAKVYTDVHGHYADPKPTGIKMRGERSNLVVPVIPQAAVSFPRARHGVGRRAH